MTDHGTAWMRARALLGIALLALAGSAFAETTRHGDLLIEDARVGAVRFFGSVTAAYATITNTGGADDRLVSVGADIAGKSEIHAMEVKDDVMRMRPLPDGLPVPAGETVALEPGGLHLMLTRLKSRPGEGDEVVLTLEFERAGAVEVRASVVETRHGH